MKTKNADILMQNKIFNWIALGTGGILLIPFIAMQFSQDVNWGPGDFIIIGALLFTIGSMFVLAARKIRRTSDRVIAGIMFALILLYLWAELAVGIFTNWGS